MITDVEREMGSLNNLPFFASLSTLALSANHYVSSLSKSILASHATLDQMRCCLREAACRK